MGILFVQWTHYVEINGGAMGMVLAAFGLCFLGLGWRFERIALSMVYGLVGAVVGCQLGAGRSDVLVYAASCAVGGVGLGMAFGRFSAPVLAGVLSAVAVWAILDSCRIPATTFYAIVGLSFAAALGVALTRHREATIVATSVIGAFLLISGLIAMVSESRTLSSQYRSLAEVSIFFPFAIAVPAVSGILLQLAASNRSDSGNVQA